MENAKKGRIIQSVQRAVDIINCFDQSHTELTLSEISLRLELNKSTVHGIISTLCANGFIWQNTSGKYLLGPALLGKAQYAASAERNMLLCAARPHMLHLSNVHKGTANLFIIEDERPVFLEQLFPANCVYVIRHVSDNDPLHRTATGKIALAYMDPQAFENYLDAADFTPVTPSSIAGPQMLKSHLEQIRLRGYSLENEELSEGVSAVSVPIFNHRDRLFGTISLTGASFHIDREKKALIPGLIKASAAISAALFNAPAESANQG